MLTYARQVQQPNMYDLEVKVCVAESGICVYLKKVLGAMSLRSDWQARWCRRYFGDITIKGFANGRWI
jgi:hypothetical protein